MASLRGFWSYVHADDQADGGRIAKLARDVAVQFEMITGDQVELFLDRDDLGWGDDWKYEIDGQLASIGFFVPVVTPRFFKSAECRRELQFFSRRFVEEKIQGLLLPILYVDVDALHEAGADTLVAIVQRFQWEDWRDLRFADPSSEVYRRGVHRLAARLAGANREAERLAVLAPTASVTSESHGLIDEEPGLIDQLATAEAALPQWNDTIEKISDHMEAIGEIFVAGQQEVRRLDQLGKGFGGRMFAARSLAKRLTEPVEAIATLTAEFTRQMYDVDAGFRAIIAEAPTEVAKDPALVPEICSFFQMLRRMSAAAHEGLSATREMAAQIEPMEKMSRDLRPPLRRLREGLIAMAEAEGVMAEWVRLAETSGVPCDDVDDALAPGESA